MLAGLPPVRSTPQDVKRNATNTHLSDSADTSDYQGGYGQPKVERDSQTGDFGREGQSNSGGREMGDAESSMSGDTVSWASCSA